MAKYLVLARKWRPQKFNDILGQEHITVTLQNALKQNKVSHSYLFAGPRGIGKTTTARILAKVLNCEKEIKEEPCNSCSSCMEITNDRSLDVLEIDGASNRGIDQIRDLRQNIKFGTAKSKFKVYIIDEVHMLTNEAFNALLKTLEEPPPHVKFIFATTEPNQIPLTILSRCQRFDFKRIPLEMIVKKLKNIAKEENIKVEEDSLFILAKSAQGSLRDAESILEQLSIFTDGQITIDGVNELLGLVDEEIFFRFTELFIGRNITGIWQLINELNYRGKDIPKLLKDFIHFLRNMLIIKEVADSSELIDIRPIYREKLKEISKIFNAEQILSLIDSLSSISYKLKRSESPLMDLEIYVLGLIKELDLPHQSHSSKTNTRVLSNEKKEEKKDVSTNPVRDKSLNPVRNPFLNGVNGTSEKSLDLDVLRKLWPDILKDIKEKSTALSTLLVNSKIKELNNNTVNIELPITNGYFTTTLEKSKVFIQNKIGERIERDIKVEFIHLVKGAQKEDIIEKTMKIFDARIVKQ